MSKEIKLTKGMVALVDKEDFEALNKFKWCANKRKNTYYAQRRNPSKNPPQIHMHREILNVPDSLMTDHIDGNGLNNQKSNLRICTQQQNGCNRGINKNNKSGYKGVFKGSGTKKYIAQIIFNNKQIYLGSFDTKHEAAIAYNKKALELHGEYAFQNVITKRSE